MQIHNNKEYSLPNSLKLIIYGRNSEHKHPKNAAVYYENDVLKSWIEAPYFKSDKMIHGIKNEEHSSSERDVWIIHPHKEKVKNFWGKVLEEKPQQGFLDAYTGIKRIEGKEYAEMVISDGGMYFELQYLDLETYQFIENANWGGRF